MSRAKAGVVSNGVSIVKVARSKWTDMQHKFTAVYGFGVPLVGEYNVGAIFNIGIFADSASREGVRPTTFMWNDRLLLCQPVKGLPAKYGEMVSPLVDSPEPVVGLDGYINVPVDSKIYVAGVPIAWLESTDPALAHRCNDTYWDEIPNGDAIVYLEALLRKVRKSGVAPSTSSRRSGIL